MGREPSTVVRKDQDPCSFQCSQEKCVQSTRAKFVHQEIASFSNENQTLQICADPNPTKALKGIGQFLGIAVALLFFLPQALERLRAQHWAVAPVGWLKEKSAHYRKLFFGNAVVELSCWFFLKNLGSDLRNTVPGAQNVQMGLS